MKKHLFLKSLLIAIGLLVTSLTSQMWAANDKFGDGQILYCKVNNTNWNGHAIQFNWYWDSGTWCSTENGNNITTNYWYHSVPNGFIGKVQFIRCKSDFSEQWDWSNEITAASRSNNYQNCVEITGSNWGGATVSWTTYRPAMSSASVVDNGTTKTGSGTSLSPYQVVTGETIKLSASSVSAVSDNAMTAQYKYFNKGSQLRDYSSTNTYSFTAGAAGTTYEITVKARNNYNSDNGAESGASTTLYYTVIAEPETTHEVTISYKCGATTIKADDTEDVGEETASSFDVVDIVGYTFSYWSLGNGLTNESGGSTTADPISITTKSSGTYTLTANYTEVLTTDWKLIGDNATNSPFGDNYSYASGKAMSKKSGASATDKAYKTLDITHTGTWGFKVATASGNSYTYGWGTSDGDYITFNRSKSGNANDVYTGNQHELKFNPDGLGEYEFEVDYTAAKCSVKVTFPTVYTVSFSKGSVDGTSGSISATYSSVSFSSGTKIQSGKSVTLTAPDEKTGYTWYGWCTNANGSGRVSTNKTYSPTISAATTLYACYTINNHTITHSASTNGDYTIKVGSAAAVSTNTTSDYGKTITLAATPATGYHFGSWSAYKTSTPGTTVTVTDNKFTMPDYAVTVGATFSPNTYTVHFHRNGGAGDVVEQNFTYDVAQNLTANTYTKTGYNFAGWALAADAAVTYADEANVSNLTATNAGTFHLYAKWSANSYTVTLDIDEANHGTIDDKDTEASVTYDAAPTAIAAAKLPTAAQGYALYGYYTDHNGEGIKLINADGTWIASVDGYTDANKKWVHDGDVTLYAYYKIGTITDLTLSPAAVIAPSTSITATPTFDPTPTGTYKVCWEVQYSNGTPLPSQPTFIPGASNAVSFSAPAASATYRLQATLKTGNDCASGTELCVYSTTFQVAGEHTVTVRYQDASGRTLKDTIHITARPLEWTTDGDITPPTITGYKFDHWNAGDGVTIKNGASTTTTTTTSSIQIKATYDGTLTAVYAKKKLIFFNNTLGWSDVYVYFYNSDKYWNDAFGSGAKQTQAFDGDKKPYWEEEHGHMTQIEGTNIWYFDYEAVGYSTRANVVFTEGNQHNYQWFNKTKAARRGDHISDLQMFVPLTTKTHDLNDTKYYNSGYWMNYPENTGYSLLIYNQKTKAGATKLYEFPFEFTEDFTMPMELVVDLEAGQTYGFEIKRADGTYYSNTGTMTANTTNWSMTTDQDSYCGLRTTAAGNYTFRFYYSSSNYRMDVTYPVAVNDYRIVYTDLATWSKDAHTASWYHPSRVITKNSSATEVKKDTVSFFWSYGSSPAIKYQTCSAVAAGSASWSAGTNISVSSYSSVLTKKGVYNFIFEQPAGGASISLVKVEPYTGKYYIRTDCAGSSKWVNYRSTDHEMTYSEYTETNHGYSHYFPHWVTNGQNVKFVIANDYSPCISDTLVEDKGTTIADITTEGNANAGRLNSGNASIRFMWKQADNKVSRAYISGSTNVSDRFLVLEGDSKMYDENGNPLSITGLNANEINLVDDQNFVYERTIQVNTGAKAKLTAKYNNKVQYFRGGSGSTAADSVELLGGNAEGKHTMRIVYDFKTNRLVTAYVPSGTIEEEIEIHADLMIVREHQEAGQQLLFNGGSLSEVETVYGVMRFNRWTLNNKEKTGGHSVVGDPKSPYERALYWISFPFNVNLSDVFGFGTYGTHWIIMEYDGAERAKKGYWKDSDGFWKYVTNRTGKVLESGKGYVLGLDLDLMKDDNTDFWANNIEQVELFFPSASYVRDISATNVTTSAEEHLYDAAAHPGHTDDRTYKDSHWNMIGVPSYANYGTTLTSNGSTTVTWATPTNSDLPYLYEWNMVDNTYTVQTGTTYPFKSMHAYMVQYHGNLYWSMASATPPVSPIVARRTYAEKPQNVEFRLALSQNDMMIDQTFVKLSNDENVSANFVFDEDLSKEYNANKANIYTVIEGNTPAAGNTMPMSEQTTVIPVGVKIATNGEYTFAMPDGTSGIGVTLIDNETGIRSNLALEDYIVNLEAATYENRFYLEISPIKNTPTDIENTDAMNSNVRKVMVDGLLYIIKDGKVFDAHGARVK